jgi:hypothetical protein
VLAEAQPECETERIGEKYCLCSGLPDVFPGDDEGQSGHDELKKRGKPGGGGGDEEGDGDDGDGDEKRRRKRRTNGIIDNLYNILVHLFFMIML